MTEDRHARDASIALTREGRGSQLEAFCGVDITGSSARREISSCTSEMIRRDFNKRAKPNLKSLVANLTSSDDPSSQLIGYLKLNIARSLKSSKPFESAVVRTNLSLCARDRTRRCLETEDVEKNVPPTPKVTFWLNGTADNLSL